MEFIELQTVIEILNVSYVFQIHYDIVGKGDASRFFEINPDSGELRVKDDFRKEPDNEYEVRLNVERTIKQYSLLILIACFMKNRWTTILKSLLNICKFSPKTNNVKCLIENLIKLPV